MAKKYGVASDYIKYTSRIKSDTSDGVAVEASQVVDLEEDKLQSDINKELKASIASASDNTYSKSEIDSKDTATLTSAKSYADEKVSALGSVYTTKGSCTAAQLKALTSAKAGDVWNIADAITIDGKAYPAGANVVCVTAFSAAIDPAATKNWDALQGLQDLTSYAKKSEIEDVAVANVKFAQSEIAQGNSISFDKTITYANGREATTVDGLAILPATSTKAGVMSAADKVKLDAVDGRVQGVKLSEGSEAIGGNFRIENLNGTKRAIIGSGAYIYTRTTIGTSALIDENIQILNEGEGCQLKNAHFGTEVFIKDNVYIGPNVGIGDNVDISNAKIGTATIGTDLQQIHNEFADKIAIGSGVQIAKGVGIAVDDSCNLVFGIEIEGVYQTKEINADDISALLTRVSALEDLLKLA